jgi:hypothetical protein
MSGRFSFPTRGEILKDRVSDSYKHILSKPSLDTFYQVIFAFSKLDTWMNAFPTGRNSISGNKNEFKTKTSLMCSEAEIPGTSYLTTEVIGARQGITEVFPTLRQYPPLNLTFYLDAHHQILECFEKWMYFINPLGPGGWHEQPMYSRLRYPEEYKDTINVSKFERDHQKITSRRVNGRLTTVSSMNPKSRMTTYKFLNAWPTNMTSMRVQYGNSDILKLNIQFAYDRYYTEFGVVDTQVAVTARADYASKENQWINTNGGDRFQNAGANDLFGTLSTFS